MSRYIDADKIEYTERYVGMDEFAGFRTMAYKEDIDVIPTADVVEITRCKDCKWCEITKYNDGEVEYGCDCVGGLNCAEADTFCSYGERKER